MNYNENKNIPIDKPFFCSFVYFYLFSDQVHKNLLIEMDYFTFNRLKEFFFNI